MFQGRRLIIATKHKKENVIAPILEKELGVICFTHPDLDTDELGTFSGEIERMMDPIATAKEKCLRAMKLADCDLGIASEGSFGPHPSMFFVNADDEFIVFIDKVNNIEIIARELSTSTNFNGKTISNEVELLEFAKHIGFPEHGLILRKSKDDFIDIQKDISDQNSLVKYFHQLHEKYEAVYVETDMRAMRNPTRMSVIEKATQKLVDKIKSTCPQCQMPGFGVTDAKQGLPCNLCGSPTNSTLAYIFVCQHCNYTKEEQYPNGKTTEDPTFCDHCNP